MSSRTSWALAGILAVAVVLRLWGTGFGEHSPLARPDEQIYALEAMGMFVRPYARLATGWPQGFFTLWHAVLRGQLLFRGDTNLPCLLALHPLAVLLPMRIATKFAKAGRFRVAQPVQVVLRVVEPVLLGVVGVDPL